MKKVMQYGFWTLVLVSFGLKAQEFSGDNELEMAVKQHYAGQADKKAMTLSAGNIVTIQQIGTRNFSNVNIKAASAMVNVQQLGANNYLELYKSAQDINQTVIQQGSNNMVNDYSMNPYYSVNNQVIQYGNNLNYTSYGTNSISDDMRIIQRGNSGSVLIFNR
ncbi:MULTISPECIES: hypothetical protein [unclassified Flavobacterium]|uniref:hypothetical protein n=1 Tax=unclassified Flavobacterium TaxID=196869 RepID=UPI00086EC90C|nr:MULTISPECIES: hypothetical protein [unclassified Flavobacterium]MBN9282859.1 hypothetical protein [Flavobacterium sp.]ODS80028.1 MAG: hypothetical protein ABS44_20895 [Chryseobacterium sp. SCN 40-13]OJV67503.1 MAG: hypothetical protein BGO42_15810 [Flavobacterium sp. 40-81]